MGKVCSSLLHFDSFSSEPILLQERPDGRVLAEVQAGDAEGDPGAGGRQHGSTLPPPDAPGVYMCTVSVYRCTVLCTGVRPRERPGPHHHRAAGLGDLGRQPGLGAHR